MTDQAHWTLDELVRRVAAALATPAYRGAPNGRVRELPDRRSVRWYATIGLLDRPVMRGRTALYGPRHLLQVVAVKRLQAQGLSLAEIQAQLTGATDETLARVAAVPEDLVGDAHPSAGEVLPAQPRRRRFWAEPPGDDVAASSASEVAGGDVDTVTTLNAIRLPGGALLVLPARPEVDDLPAIRAAAQPLLDVLADRGLLSL